MEENSTQEGSSSESKRSILTNPTLMGWIAIIGLPLGIWGIYLTFAFNKEARPVYRVMGNFTLTRSLESSKIKVFYDTIPVSDVRLVHVYIWNAGNEFIDKSAFAKDRPITISCNKAIGILDVQQIKVTRPDLMFSTTMSIIKGGGTPPDTTLVDGDSARAAGDSSSRPNDYINIEIAGDEGLESKDGVLYQIMYTTNANDCKWYVDARIKGIPQGFTEATDVDAYFKLVGYSLYFIFACWALYTFLAYVIRASPSTIRTFMWIGCPILFVIFLYFFISLLPTLKGSFMIPEELLANQGL